MIKDGGLSFETQLKIEFLSLNNVSKKCLEKFLVRICNILAIDNRHGLNIHQINSSNNVKEPPKGLFY